MGKRCFQQAKQIRCIAKGKRVGHHVVSESTKSRIIVIVVVIVLDDRGHGCCFCCFCPLIARLLFEYRQSAIRINHLSMLSCSDGKILGLIHRTCQTIFPTTFPTTKPKSAEGGLVSLVENSSHSSPANPGTNKSCRPPKLWGIILLCTLIPRC